MHLPLNGTASETHMYIFLAVGSTKNLAERSFLTLYYYCLLLSIIDGQKSICIICFTDK